MKKGEPQNRRRAPRLQHEIPVAYRTAGSFLSDWATNISRGGLFINTRRPLPVGTLLRVVLQVPGAEAPFSMSGRVTRVAEWGNETNVAPGMALEFTDLEGANRELLQTVVERLRRDLELARGE